MVKGKARILIRKGKKQFFEDIGREVTTVKEKRLFISDTSKDFSTQYGTIKKTDLKKTGIIKTAQDKEFHIFDAMFIDDYKHLKRAPQIIPLKDIGYILAQTGVGKESTVIEGGAGSGALTIMLARVCKKVHAFEIEDKHFDVVKENLTALGIRNVSLKKDSMYGSLGVKDADLACLDLPSPWEAIPPVVKALKPGGFIVSYSPTIVQTSDFVNALQEHDNLIHLKTVEVIERPWEVEKRKVRPISKGIIHSGFITLARKLS
ncbi:RsmD family RNA methyltransferase [Candidatus Woesearchaeota archaeon]|nr:RsmD family RNA methyltransferase [Candidatus Woesearchaeota archaeon]